MAYENLKKFLKDRTYTRPSGEQTDAFIYITQESDMTESELHKFSRNFPREARHASSSAGMNIDFDFTPAPSKEDISAFTKRWGNYVPDTRVAVSFKLGKRNIDVTHHALSKAREWLSSGEATDTEAAGRFIFEEGGSKYRKARIVDFEPVYGLVADISVQGSSVGKSVINTEDVNVHYHPWDEPIPSVVDIANARRKGGTHFVVSSGHMSVYGNVANEGTPYYVSDIPNPEKPMHRKPLSLTEMISSGNVSRVSIFDQKLDETYMEDEGNIISNSGVDINAVFRKKKNNIAVSEPLSEEGPTSLPPLTRKQARKYNKKQLESGIEAGAVRREKTRRRRTKTEPVVMDTPPVVPVVPSDTKLASSNIPIEPKVLDGENVPPTRHEELEAQVSSSAIPQEKGGPHTGATGPTSNEMAGIPPEISPTIKPITEEKAGFFKGGKWGIFFALAGAAAFYGVSKLTQHHDQERKGEFHTEHYQHMSDRVARKRADHVINREKTSLRHYMSKVHSPRASDAPPASKLALWVGMGAGAAAFGYTGWKSGLFSGGQSGEQLIQGIGDAASSGFKAWSLTAGVEKVAFGDSARTRAEGVADIANAAIVPSASKSILSILAPKLTAAGGTGASLATAGTVIAMSGALNFAARGIGSTIDKHSSNKAYNRPTKEYNPTSFDQDTTIEDPITKYNTPGQLAMNIISHDIPIGARDFKRKVQRLHQFGRTF